MNLFMMLLIGAKIALDEIYTLTLNSSENDSIYTLECNGYEQDNNMISTRLGQSVIQGDDLKVADYLNNNCIIEDSNE